VTPHDKIQITIPASFQDIAKIAKVKKVPSLIKDMEIPCMEDV